MVFSFSSLLPSSSPPQHHILKYLQPHLKTFVKLSQSFQYRNYSYSVHQRFQTISSNHIQLFLGCPNNMELFHICPQNITIPNLSNNHIKVFIIISYQTISDLSHQIVPNPPQIISYKSYITIPNLSTNNIKLYLPNCLCLEHFSWVIFILH